MNYIQFIIGSNMETPFKLHLGENIFVTSQDSLSNFSTDRQGQA